MIDYFALALGHGLLAIALLRLVLRDGLDTDPLIEQITAETANNRKATSIAGRNEVRRAHSNDESDPDNPGAQAAQRSRTTRVQAAERKRTNPGAQAAER